MAETVSWVGLAIALLLPWLCGSVWVCLLLRGTGRANAALLLGQGFFVGHFGVTLLLRLWDAIGLPLGFLPLSIVLALLSLAGLLLLRGRRTVAVAASARGRTGPAAALCIGVLLLMLLSRYVVLAQELLLRPLYGWDAWMNWVPKAIVWYHHGSLVDFVSPAAWLNPGPAETYTLGNTEAWDYPISVPLIQLWAMLAAGTTDHPALYLSWLLTPLCLALLLYGHLRLAGLGSAACIGACYVLLSMPYINVHTALAGYADLWLGAVFGAAVCALYEWSQCRQWRHAVLCLVLAAFCAQIKVTGIFLGLIVVALLLRAWLRLSPWQDLLAAAAMLAGFAVLMTAGASFTLPHLGQVVLGWE
ncbi:MAG: hypothetical protein R3228_09475, partial [Halioglobus sp.]|nr:hypothetical protein [Halioglobus sp.]